MMRRRRSSLADDVAPTLDALARATAGGHSLPRAIAALPSSVERPFSQLLCEAVTHSAVGQPLHEALAHLNSEQPGPEVALALTTLEMLARYGGSVPLALDRAAVTVRERRAAVHERRAHAAQARLSAVVLSILPIGFVFWGLQSDRRTERFLLHQHTGWWCLAVGLVLNCSGWFWMRHLIGGTA